MLAVGTTLGPYKIIAPLGAGGMGEVYRARDTRLGRDVALKVIRAEVARDPERIKRFEQEARAAGALSHPNVCAIYDVGTHEAVPFVVMELLEGESLRAKLGGGPIPVRKTLDYATQAAHGLAAAHEKGIVHRDLKPENLFVTKDGRVKLLDFGLAKLTRPEVLASAGETPVSIATTETRAILGTVGYMAPEQVRGEAADARSDLFALGAILYELLTGKRAFHAASYVETLHAILNDDPAPLAACGRELPLGLEPIMRRCLEKSPAERFQSASDLAFDLESASGSGVRMAAMPAVEKRTWPRIAATAAVILAVALGVLWIARRPPPNPPSFRRLTFRRGTVWSARFAPDGHTIAYCAAWDGDSTRLLTTHDQSHESNRLELPSGRLLSVSSTGELAVLLDAVVSPDYAYEARGTLSRVPLGGGAPRRLLEDVTEADWAPDGSRLAVVRELRGHSRIELPPGHVLYESAGAVRSMRVSPRGDRIAFMEHPVPTDSRGTVAVVDLAGRRETLASGWEDESGLAWSPRGDEVWFTASEVGYARALWAVTLRKRLRLVLRMMGGLTLLDIGKDGRVLAARVEQDIVMAGTAPGQASERRLSWMDWSTSSDLSGDGRQVLFTEFGEGAGLGYAACLRGTDGSPVMRLGEGYATSLSPDGRWVIAILQGKQRALVLYPTGAGESRTLPAGSITNFEWAAWFPDGRRIVFSGYASGHGIRCYVQDVASGRIRPLTAEGMHLFNPGANVSPDGRWVVVTDFVRNAYLVPADGGEPQVVPGLTGRDVAVAWSTDGRSVFGYRLGTIPQSIYRCDLRTGRRQVWREVMPSDPAGVVTIGGIKMTRDGRTLVYTYYRSLSGLYLAGGLR